MQLSPLQPYENGSSSDYPDRKLLQLYPDLDAVHDWLSDPHQSQWSILYVVIPSYIQIFPDIILLLSHTG